VHVVAVVVVLSLDEAGRFVGEEFRNIGVYFVFGDGDVLEVDESDEVVL